jgi:hypothetical protein
LPPVLSAVLSVLAGRPLVSSDGAARTGLAGAEHQVGLAARGDHEALTRPPPPEALVDRAGDLGLRQRAVAILVGPGQVDVEVAAIGQLHHQRAAQRHRHGRQVLKGHLVGRGDLLDEHTGVARRAVADAVAVA